MKPGKIPTRAAIVASYDGKALRDAVYFDPQLRIVIAEYRGRDGQTVHTRDSLHRDFQA
jgi:hypothetical protein